MISKPRLLQPNVKVRHRRPPRLELLAVALAMLVIPRAAWAIQSVYELVALPGLTDAEHTDEQGNHFSAAHHLDGTGLVFGHSNRVPPSPSGPAWHGVTGWVYDPLTGVTTRAALDADPYAPPDQVCSNGVVEPTALGFGLGATGCGTSAFPELIWAYDSHDRAKSFLGLSDPDHTNPITGRPLSRLLPYSAGRISSSGHITGTTIRWQPAPGDSAWLYDSTTRSTSRIGLFDADHTASDGAQYSTPWILSDAGNVAGYSDRYLAATFVGASAWIQRQTTGVIRRVGLYDGDGRGSQGFTAADGRQVTAIVSLSDSAYAAGISVRFQGAERFGEVAWRYRIADDSMILLGFADPMHTRADGARTSGVIFATEAGHVLGASARYDAGSEPLSSTPWLFDASSLETKVIGLYDSVHTSPEGLQQNRVHVLTESGHAAGSATRLGSWIPGSSQGTSVWVARTDSPSTTRIGLVDSATLGAAQFTSLSGEQDSAFVSLLESGDVIGSSLAYLGDDPAGSAAWYYDASAGTTRPIGLYGPSFTAPDGFFASAATHWTETGFVAGHSVRSDQFRTLWIYSAQTDEVDAIAPLHPPAPGGYVLPEILFLSDTGMVLGRFTFFEENSPEEIVRFFVWTPTGGTVYLDERIANGFESAGWVSIETIEAVSGDRILGSGRRSNCDVDGLMLVPVPEPSQITLVSICCLAAAWQFARPNRKHRTAR